MRNNKRNNKQIFFVVVAVLLTAVATGWFTIINMRANNGTATPAVEQQPATSSAEPGTLSGILSPPQVLYWYDPMRPTVHFDKPGPSPFMDMALVPKYAASAAPADKNMPATTIDIDPRMVQQLGMRTVAVERGTFWQRIDTTGAVTLDESRTQVVEARATGQVRRLHVRSIDAPVRAGDVLLSVYAPELLAAQEELLISTRSGDAELLSATRERLTLLGISPAQIKAVEKNDRATQQVALLSPISGIVTELNVREGSQVAPGMVLARIAALDRVWVMVDIPEAQIAWLHGKRPAEVRLTAFPQRVFAATVDYVYPQLDAATRTLRARLVIDNRDLLLRPGMYASVTVFGGPRHDVLLVPDEAVIRTGQRNLVIVAEGAGRFRPVTVTAGAERNGMTVIESGLDAGVQVVVSGQFLLESEANLQGVLQRLAPAAVHEKHDAAETVEVAP